MKKHIGRIDFFDLDKGILAVIGEAPKPLEPFEAPVEFVSGISSASGIEIYAEKGSSLMAEVTRTMKAKHGWK